MNKYSSYKDSGVEWIGYIPNHWIIGKWRFYFKSGMGQTILKEQLIDNGNTPIFSATEEDVNFGYIDNPKLLLEKGDIVVPARGNSIGHVKLVKVPSTTTQTTIYSKKKSDKINSNYIYYYCKGNKINLFPFVQTAIPQITVDEINSNHVLLPPLTEQQQIVAFLDNKTEKIDNLISHKQKKIDILKEKRTALINHVVTKGLNPDVELKDSGVEWIGEIPKHWEIMSLMYLGSFQNGVSKGAEYFGKGYPFMNYGDVYKNEVTPIKVKGKVDLDDIERKRYSVLRGDVFFTRTSESKDDIGVSSTCLKTIEECSFSGFVIRFRFHVNKHLPEYSRYHFQTHWKKVLIESKMNIVTRASLSQQVLGQVPVLIPSIEEQQQIVDYLDQQTKEIEDLIKLEQQKIELLKEYRQSLISEVVTGKLRVCEEDLF